MKIRPYSPKDKSRCIQIFESNTPKYFAAHEYRLFVNWLNDYQFKEYYVVEQANKIIACGGVYLDERYNKASLSWGMVHAKYHGEGVGRKFTEFRIKKMMDKYDGHSYMMETSQHTKGFYEKLGFQTKKIIPNGFGEGLDKYYMELD
jgi:ribosomal protein S18 acetylase RimI-like enzyme